MGDPEIPPEEPEDSQTEPEDPPTEPEEPLITSILTCIKRLLGIDEDYTQFDPDILVHINSAFTTLLQLGIGPEEGFSITGATETWSEFIEDRTDIELVKTYIYLKVRLIFDPPQTGYLVDAITKQVLEIEWRLCE